MSNGQYKGLLSKDSQGKLGEMGDKLIKFKKPILEKWDDKFIEMTIGLLDTLFGDKIPAEYEEPVNQAISDAYDAYIGGDKTKYDDAIMQLVEVIIKAAKLEEKIGTEYVLIIRNTLTMVLQWIFGGV